MKNGENTVYDTDGFYGVTCEFIHGILDENMVSSLNQEFTDNHTIRSVIDVSRRIVEGIETEEQYLNFKKLGVEYIQGYYFSKPLPKERVLNYVREWL